MRSYLDCTACFLRQALDAARRATDDPDVHERVVRRVLGEVAGFSFDEPPPLMGRRIHAIIREETGEADPYREAKEATNRLALRLLSQLREELGEAVDGFEPALRLAVAANVIDLGAKTERDVDEASVRAELERALTAPLSASAVERLRSALDDAERVLYLTDNAGEIAFDRLLVERLPAPEIIVGVRGAPIINDATADDARAVGLDEVARIVTNGGPTPGTVLSECPPALREAFEQADVVIAKGQGNYETLSDETRAGLFFLVRTKCAVLARDLGCRVGEMVVREAARPAGS
jgi:hypothetical protein